MATAPRIHSVITLGDKPQISHIIRTITESPHARHVLHVNTHTIELAKLAIAARSLAKYLIANRDALNRNLTHVHIYLKRSRLRVAVVEGMVGTVRKFNFTSPHTFHYTQNNPGELPIRAGQPAHK